MAFVILIYILYCHETTPHTANIKDFMRSWAKHIPPALGQGKSVALTEKCWGMHAQLRIKFCWTKPRPHPSYGCLIRRFCFGCVYFKCNFWNMQTNHVIFNHRFRAKDILLPCPISLLLKNSQFQRTSAKLLWWRRCKLSFPNQTAFFTKRTNPRLDAGQFKKPLFETLFTLFVLPLLYIFWAP